MDYEPSKRTLTFQYHGATYKYNNNRNNIEIIEYKGKPIEECSSRKFTIFSYEIFTPMPAEAYVVPSDFKRYHYIRAEIPRVELEEAAENYLKEQERKTMFVQEFGSVENAIEYINKTITNFDMSVAIEHMKELQPVQAVEEYKRKNLTPVKMNPVLIIPCAIKPLYHAGKSMHFIINALPGILRDNQDGEAIENIIRRILGLPHIVSGYWKYYPALYSLMVKYNDYINLPVAYSLKALHLTKPFRAEDSGMRIKDEEQIVNELSISQIEEALGHFGLTVEFRNQ